MIKNDHSQQSAIECPLPMWKTRADESCLDSLYVWAHFDHNTHTHEHTNISKKEPTHFYSPKKWINNAHKLSAQLVEAQIQSILLKDKDKKSITIRNVNNWTKNNPAGRRGMSEKKSLTEPEPRIGKKGRNKCERGKKSRKKRMI